METVKTLQSYSKRTIAVDWGLYFFFTLASILFLLRLNSPYHVLLFWTTLGFVGVFIIWALGLILTDVLLHSEHTKQILLILVILSLLPLFLGLVYLTVQVMPVGWLLAYSLGCLFAIAVAIILFGIITNHRLKIIREKLLKEKSSVILKVVVPTDPNNWENYVKKHYATINSFEFNENFPPIQGYVTAGMKKTLARTRSQNTMALISGKMYKRDYRKILAHEGVFEITFEGPIVHHQDIADCTARSIGSITDVAEHIGAPAVWDAGIRGRGAVIGIMDFGVRACDIGDGNMQKRTLGSSYEGWSQDENALPIGSATPICHGTMLAWDALNIAPEAKIVDIGVGRAYPGEDPNTNWYRNCLWALDDIIKMYNDLPQARRDGRVPPNIIVVSWSISHISPNFCKHTHDPHDDLTIKFLELMNKGVIICFAAGNCGEECPNRQACQLHVGSGFSIWGVNGHPESICVGAHNIDDPVQRLGNSSQGPSLLCKAMGVSTIKPDILAPGNFIGYSQHDNSTSAANAIVAGVCALLFESYSQQNQQLTHAIAREILISTAKDPLQLGLPNDSWGYGCVNAVDACGVSIPAQRGPSDYWAPQEAYPCGDIINLCRCFIATAAFDSPLNHHVQFLREYRDKVLLQSTFRAPFERLLNTYYKFSPPIATKMRQSKTLKRLVKYSIVYPIVIHLKSMLSLKQAIARK
jgi:hypothetical protein